MIKKDITIPTYILYSFMFFQRFIVLCYSSLQLLGRCQTCSWYWVKIKKQVKNPSKLIPYFLLVVILLCRGYLTVDLLERNSIRKKVLDESQKPSLTITKETDPIPCRVVSFITTHKTIEICESKVIAYE